MSQQAAICPIGLGEIHCPSCTFHPEDRCIYPELKESKSKGEQGTLIQG